MARRLKRLKSKRKRRAERKDKIPFGNIRKPIPRPGVEMESKKTYNRKGKHVADWGVED